jgi:hypothetical protein
MNSQQGTFATARELKADEETLQAQKTWLETNTVPLTYLRSVLGEVSMSVSAWKAPPDPRNGASADHPKPGEARRP